MFLRYVAGGVLLSGLLGAGSAVSYKQNLIKCRRAALTVETDELTRQMRGVSDEHDSVLSARESAMRRVTEERDVFHTLWEDRLQRYEEANSDALSYLTALPEGLGILKGLSSHYRYMHDELRHYVGYDIAASKVHNLTLLCNGSDATSIQRVVKSLKGLFAVEPLIQEVCGCAEGFLDACGGRAAANLNVADVSRTFLFCVSALEGSVESAASRRIQMPSDDERRHGNVMLHALSTLLNKAKLSFEDTTADETLNRLEQEIVQDKRRLWSESDVREAVRYVDAVIHRLEADSSPLVRSIADDEAVQASKQQLRVWQEGATAFLVGQQTQRALSAYQKLLSLSLVNVQD